MNIEYHAAPIHLKEPSRRILDATAPFFDDYGYRSVNRAIRAISESLHRRRTPHLFFIVGESKNGKEHLLRDILGKLHQGKRGEGVLTKIAAEQGYPVPTDVVYWGNSFSVAKAKGRTPEDKKYGEYNDDEIAITVEEYGNLITQVVTERQGQPALIISKAVLLTGARIDGQLVGRNRGLPVFEDVVFRRGPFKDLLYEVFLFGMVADPAAVEHGNDLRTEAEQKIGNKNQLVKTLIDKGEIILTEQGEQTRLTDEQADAIVEYISEGGNIASSWEIAGYINYLAITLSEKGRLRFGGYEYSLSPKSYFFDEEDHVYRFYDPRVRMLAVALLMRYIFAENLKMQSKVFLGKTQKIEERILDLRHPPRNVAKAYFPAIVNIRNK